MGASARGAGRSATQTHMTNTLNTPVEAFEHQFPVRVESYHIRRGSGGAGEHRGGDGIVRELRFLAPADMQDGTYTVRLILRDKIGHTYREAKTFVIASKPPIVQVKLDRKRFQRGQTIDLKVSASESTRTLVARLDGAVPVALHWDANAATNSGSLTVPEQAIPGTYKLTITAEDIAHNIGTQEVPIEVLP